MGHMVNTWVVSQSSKKSMLRKTNIDIKCWYRGDLCSNLLESLNSVENSQKDINSSYVSDCI